MKTKKRKQFYELYGALSYWWTGYRWVTNEELDNRKIKPIKMRNGGYGNMRWLGRDGIRAWKEFKKCPEGFRLIKIFGPKKKRLMAEWIRYEKN